MVAHAYRYQVVAIDAAVELVSLAFVVTLLQFQSRPDRSPQVRVLLLSV